MTCMHCGEAADVVYQLHERWPLAGHVCEPCFREIREMAPHPVYAVRGNREDDKTRAQSD
ncbi:hypothetical protein [Pimelobacter simplex]|uniref:hypothetical protein n=1 Tax=Nocardioides simplex TaxID=2045 RepID=UPI00214FC992|nr:hypothetical protein [Pimelobacter simplex]UUW88454.1 hypothetical protein M0M43_22305 [Pimelobacter simplex]UUW97958.1 hypothetical protein M0M48_10950 [Pimelobacter simplex]